MMAITTGNSIRAKPGLDAVLIAGFLRGCGRRVADLAPSPGSEAVEASDLEVPAGPWPVLVVAAAAEGRVEPEAGGTEGGEALRLSRLLGLQEPGEEVGAIPAEPLPGLLALLAEDPAEGRERHHPAAGGAVVARSDDRQGSGHGRQPGSGLGRRGGRALSLRRLRRLIRASCRIGPIRSIHIPGKIALASRSQAGKVSWGSPKIRVRRDDAAPRRPSSSWSLRPLGVKVAVRRHPRPRCRWPRLRLRPWKPRPCRPRRWSARLYWARR